MDHLGYALLAMIGMILTGLVKADMRYAKAEEVRQQVDSIKRLYIQSERRALKKEEFDLLNEQEQRRLTKREKERLGHVQDELKQIERDLTLRPMEAPR